ncbi:MAG: malonyl-ACP O-methyltransferase BioC [Sulfuricella sp.]|nr:malonyl-ACP O-methyltransferase BioC [Sulfuricella sp.]
MTDQFTLDKRRVRRSFDRAATTYDRVAVLQREICERMAERLQYVKFEPQVVLDAGCGTGYGSELLRKRYAKSRVIELDLAPAMLRASRERQSGWKRLLPFMAAPAQICGDLETLPLRDGSVGMIWSNLALQWCNDLEATFSGMHRALQSGGLLMFTTFGSDTLKELRQVFGALDADAHVNRFADMHDVGDALMQAGFAAPVMDMETVTLTYDDLAGLMRDLKALGAHNANQGRGRGLLGKGAWQRLQQGYEALRRDGKLPATYEVVYGHAWKGEKKQQPGELQVVKFHDLKMINRR